MGFLHTRASIMIDVVVVAMAVVLPALALSVWLVKYRRRFRLHKAIQLTLAVVLFATVAAFEVDMRFYTDWNERAAPSPYYGGQWVLYCLWIHIFFAATTLALWVYTIAGALRHFPSPPQPGPYSPRHIFWARLAAIDMALTAVSGWIFYWMAFVAR
jgi:uncharacterized membrane protein YozB (DUF420 family)